MDTQHFPCESPRITGVAGLQAVTNSGEVEVAGPELVDPPVAAVDVTQDVFIGCPPQPHVRLLELEAHRVGRGLVLQVLPRRARERSSVR